MTNYCKIFNSHNSYTNYRNNPENENKLGVGCCLTEDIHIHYDPILAVKCTFDNNPDIVLLESKLNNGSLSRETLMTNGFDILARGPQSYNSAYMKIYDSVTELDNTAYGYISIPMFSWLQITKIEFPNTVTVIPDFCCQSCGILQTIILGNNVTSIGMFAFEDLDSPDIIINTPTPPSIHQNAFTASNIEYILEDYKIYVPDEAVNTYKTDTNWAPYASIIYSINDYNE